MCKYSTYFFHFYFYILRDLTVYLDGHVYFDSVVRADKEYIYFVGSEGTLLPFGYWV